MSFSLIHSALYSSPSSLTVSRPAFFFFFLDASFFRDSTLTNDLIRNRGFAPSKSTASAPGTGANAAPLPPKAPSSPNASLNPEAAEAKEEKRRRKAEKQARKEEKRARKQEKKAHRTDREGGLRRYESDDSEEDEAERRPMYRDERSPVRRYRDERSPARRYRDERSRSPRRNDERDEHREQGGRYRERSPVPSSRAPRDYGEREREREREMTRRRWDDRDSGRARHGRD